MGHTLYIEASIEGSVVKMVDISDHNYLLAGPWEQWLCFNTLRLRQNDRHFTDDNFKCIFFNENVWIVNKNLLKLVPKGPIDNKSSMVQMMAWHRAGDKP